MDDREHPVTSWHTLESALGFDRFDKQLWFRLGYDFLPGELRLDSPQVRTALDLGCGTGTIANSVARTWGVRVVGVDSSAAMIAQARQQAELGTTYHRMRDEQTMLAAQSLDAAWAAFVFVCVPSADRLRRLAAELYRVLRPGARVCILDSHPDTLGVEFDGLVQGEAGTAYRPGDPLPVRMRNADGTWESIVDVYWPRETYDEVLTGAGFEIVRHRSPVAADLDPAAVAPELARRWRTAYSHPPFLLITAERPHTGG